MTECLSGGVPRAIESIVRASGTHEHHVLWPAANTTDSTANFASIADLPDSQLDRFKAVRDAVRIMSPDVVHAHSSFAGAYSRLRKLPVPVIYQPHGYKFEDDSSPRIARAVFRMAERALAKRASAIVVLSPREDELTQALSSKVPRYFVPNAPSVTPEGGQEPLAANLHEVAMIGRLSNQKDPGFFAEVVKLVVAHGAATRFTWIGGGTDDQVSEMESQGIRVTGWLTEGELLIELQRPWIYLHSARYEGFPLSVLDAAAFGHPIVVRRIAAFVGTDLLQADDPQEAASLVLEILSGGTARQVAISGGTRLLDEMNLRKQREALDSLYGKYANQTRAIRENCQ